MKDVSTNNMNAYNFEATDFALSEQGIHLLRSRYNYKTIAFEKIEQATIKRTAEIDNVILALVLGVILFAFALLQTVNLVQLFNDPEVHRIHIEAIVLPLFPGLIGFYLIYVALRKGPVLIVVSGNSKKKLRLREFHKRNQVQEVRNYLSHRLSHRLHIQE